MKVTGFDEMQKTIRELQKAVSELDGELGSVQFDPNDPQSIELAIQSAFRAIDARVANYSRNEVVSGLVTDLKEDVRAKILDHASAARLESGDDR